MFGEKHLLTKYMPPVMQIAHAIFKFWIPPRAPIAQLQIVIHILFGTLLLQLHVPNCQPLCKPIGLLYNERITFFT